MCREEAVSTECHSDGNKHRQHRSLQLSLYSAAVTYMALTQAHRVQGAGVVTHASLGSRTVNGACAANACEPGSSEAEA